MNILVVDDEPIIRQWFSMTIEKIGYPYHVVGEAGNGIEALEFCGKHKVDLVVTDIKMPQMDGIELIKALKQRTPHIRSLILSSYSEFEYAAEALKNGASDYLLKLEVSIGQLKETFEKIAKEINLEKISLDEFHRIKGFLNENQYSLRSVYLQKLINGDETARQQFDQQMKVYRVKIASENLIIISIGIDGKENVKIKEKELLSQAIVNIVDETLYMEIGNGCSFPYDDKTFVALLNIGDKSEKSQKEMLHLCTSQVSNHLERYLAVSCSIGISKLYHQLNMLPVQFAEAKEALNRRLFYGDRSIVFFQDPHYTDLTGAQNEMNELLAQFEHDMDAGEVYEASRKLQNFLHRIEMRKHLSDKQVRAVCLETIMIYLRKLRNLGIFTDELAAFYENIHVDIHRFVTFQEMKQWVIDKVGGWLVLIASNEQRYCEPVQKACSYMKQNYHSDISLQHLADHVHLSRTYVSELFKKETGISISDYLTEIRIHKAKELLWSKDYKIGSLAEMVGYSNASYFIKMFKKHTNMSPMEYRERLFQTGQIN